MTSPQRRVANFLEAQPANTTNAAATKHVTVLPQRCGLGSFVSQPRRQPSRRSPLERHREVLVV